MKNFIFCFLFILISCSGGTKDGSKEDFKVKESPKDESPKKDALTIHVDMDQMSSVSIHDLFSEIDIVFLETNENCLIRGPRKVEFVDNKFYILGNLRTLFVFDEKGKHLYNIGKSGDGPEEYLHIGDFIVDPENNLIELLAPGNSAIYQYDLKGNFLNKISLPDLLDGAYSAIFNLNSDTILCWTYEYHNRLKYYSRKENKIVYETFPEEQGDFFCPYEFLKSNYLCRGLDNNVYEINDKELLVAYKWDFGKYNQNPDAIKKQANNRFDLNYINNIQNSETANFVLGGQLKNSTIYYSRVIRKNNIYTVMYNLQKDECLFFDTMIEGVKMYPLWMDDKYMIGTHFPDQIEDVVNKSIVSDEQYKTLSTRKEDDNPVLIKYSF